MKMHASEPETCFRGKHPPPQKLEEHLWLDIHVPLATLMTWNGRKAGYLLCLGSALPPPALGKAGQRRTVGIEQFVLCHRPSPRCGRRPDTGCNLRPASCNLPTPIAASDGVLGKSVGVLVPPCKSSI